MLVLVAVGVMNMAWMAGLTAVIFVEKVWRSGKISTVRDAYRRAACAPSRTILASAKDRASPVTTNRSRRTILVCETLQVIPRPRTTMGCGYSRCSCPGGTGGARTRRAPPAARDGGSRLPSLGRKYPRPGAAPPCCSAHWRRQRTRSLRYSPMSRSRVPRACWSAGTARTRSRPVSGGSWPRPLGNSPGQTGPREVLVPGHARSDNHFWRLNPSGGVRSLIAADELVLSAQ
jgi:hypothetical protein